MSFSEKKFLKKLKQQEMSNPGNKTSYEQPWRGRATVFKDKTKYNRQATKQKLRKEFNDEV